MRLDPATAAGVAAAIRAGWLVRRPPACPPACPHPARPARLGRALAQVLGPAALAVALAACLLILNLTA